MHTTRRAVYIALALALVASFIPFPGGIAKAALPKQVWSPFDLPSESDRVIPRSGLLVQPGNFTFFEIDSLAIGSDGTTFYAVDIPNSKIYRSFDAGLTWRNIESGPLLADLPVWSVTVAPDDPKIVAVVASNRRKVYLSTDSGGVWTDAGLNTGASFEISSIAISPLYGTNRDIAVGTRRDLTAPPSVDTRRIWTRRFGQTGVWQSQGLVAQDVTSIAFSPNYSADTVILVVSSNTADTFLHIGDRNTVNNTTRWDSVAGFSSYPVSLDSVAEDEIITSDIELPSDYNADQASTRQAYVAYDFNDGTRQGKIVHVDDAQVEYITPTAVGSSTASVGNGISSISLYGSTGAASILAVEAIANPITAQVQVWRTGNAQEMSPMWVSPANLKQPTGGGVSPGWANPQIMWSPDGALAYCGTGWVAVNLASDWSNPIAWTTGQPRDESALSISLDNADTWNQISLIDTEITRFSDVAVTANNKTLYLASINKAGPLPVPYQPNPGFDSIWLTISTPIGKIWERVLCAGLSNEPDVAGAGDSIILRLNPRSDNTSLIVLAVVNKDLVNKPQIMFSRDRGQTWGSTSADYPVTDISLAAEDVAYVLAGTFVQRATISGGSWRWGNGVDTCLLKTHTIATPLKNPTDESWVFVGSDEQGQVSWANFSAKIVEWKHTAVVPHPGRLHMTCDDKFESNKIIYVASDSSDGRIYRYTLGGLDLWEELKPPDRQFFGVVEQFGVLYGAWWNDPGGSGADRTLYPKAFVPPPPDWDNLTAGLIPDLPALPEVSFTREPSSLRTSLDTDIYLWAIDNRDYQPSSRQGLLWAYVDTLAMVGPFAVSPFPGELIPVDPVSGRSSEINFRWRDLPYADEYEFWLAKDSAFTLRMMTIFVGLPQEGDSPALILAPGIVLPGGHLIEAGHTYYWKVRAHRAIPTGGAEKGELVSSPWSATMFFTVRAGLPTESRYIGPMLLSPAQRAVGVPVRPVAFSWTQYRDITEYEFQLARTPDMMQPIADAQTPTTAYSFDSGLDYSATYFWRVRSTRPFASDWSPMFSFTTESAPARVPTSATPETVTEQPTPWWTWLLILLGVLLYVGVVVLVLRKRPARGRGPTTDMRDVIKKGGS